MSDKPATTASDWRPLAPTCGPCPEGTCFPGPCKLYVAQPPSARLRQEAAYRKREMRRLQAIIVETAGEVQRIEALAAQMESEGR